MKKTLNLYITTDVHATLQTRSYSDHSDKFQGLARYSSALKEARKNEDVLALDNGDILQGSPLFTYFHREERKPHLLAQAMNLIGIDYFNLGNHDFNYGPAILNQFLHDLKAPCLTANILQHGSPFGQSHLIDWKGHKIALIGSCTDYIPHWEKPSNILDMTFLDPIEIITQEVKRLRNQAELIIVMIHGGLERDPITGYPTEPLTGENDGYALAQIPGIDLLITGHQHRSIITQINQTLVTQCAYNAQEFAKVEVSFGPVVQLAAQLVKMKDFPEDQAVLDLIQPWQDQTEVWLDQPITTLHDYDFRIRDPFEARIHKHPLVSLINQIQLEVTGAQLSGTSLFNDPIGFNPNVTTRDIVSTYIYPNTLVVKQIDGIKLKAYLEKCAEYFIVTNNEIKVNPEYDSPKAQHFNYDMVDGIDYTLNISNPVGQRVTVLSYQGHPVKPKDQFTLVINNYRSSGGGNFFMITECPTVSEINTDMTEIMSQYLESHPKLKLSHKNNIEVTL